MAETVFSIKGQALKLDTAADLETHVQALKESSDFLEIHLEGNTIGIGAAEELARLISQQKSLEIANLADIFTGRLLSEIPTALSSLLTALLESCPKLHTINLNDNAFGLNTVEPLRPFLSKCVSLQHLYLNNNGLGPQAGSLVAESLAALAEKKHSARKDDSSKSIPDLETVVCGRNRLETGSMKSWSQAFQAHGKALKTVKMVQNGIRQEGIAHLLQQGLSACTSLEVLDLQDNTFTILAAGTLSTTIARWPALKELGVGDCLLGARGGRKVGDALSHGQNKSLEVLRLQYNDIDAKGVKAIVDAAVSMPRLRRVELNGNKFSEEDPNIERLQEILSGRKSDTSKYPEVDGDDEDAWGLDELDELEDDDDEDEEEADKIGDEEEKVVKAADEAEDQPVAQEKDKDVDELADALGKTELK